MFHSVNLLFSIPVLGTAAFALIWSVISSPKHCHYKVVEMRTNFLGCVLVCCLYTCIIFLDDDLVREFCVLLFAAEAVFQITVIFNFCCRLGQEYVNAMMITLNVILIWTMLLSALVSSLFPCNEFLSMGTSCLFFSFSFVLMISLIFSIAQLGCSTTKVASVFKFLVVLIHMIYYFLWIFVIISTFFQACDANLALSTHPMFKGGIFAPWVLLGSLDVLYLIVYFFVIFTKT